MLNSQNLIDKICSKLDEGNLTQFETCQINSALNFLNNPVISVETFNDLPNGKDYIGRMIYVNGENKYYYSTRDGIWIDSLDSEFLQYADVALGWGLNGSGQLGDGTVTCRSSPVSVVGGFTDWCQVSASSNHSLGIRANGTAWAWGLNGSGQLGDGTVTCRSSPVSVIGGFTDWCQVSGGSNHSLGLRSNGTAWAWGFNGSGQLGDGTTTNSLSPVTVAGGFTDWCQVSGGSNHSLGLRSNGTAWAWGSNGSGQLGDGTIANRSSPVSVAGGFTDWCQVSGGNIHSLGVRANGTAWAWGFNSGGRLGDGTTIDSSSPVSVIGGFTDWCQVSSGSFHSLGLRSNGTVWAWGSNYSGRLGDGTVYTRSSPVTVAGGFTDWCQVSGGSSHSLGVRANGTAWAWGFNSGRLGDGTTINSSSPVTVAGGFTDWCQVSGGSNHSLGLRSLCKGLQ